MIIIPTYNERENIGLLVERIRKVLPFETILFVDDSSPDGTTAEIKNFQKADPKIELITRPQKSGFASAHITGLKFGLERGEEFLITMDSDLSHPPEILPLMINCLRGNDVVIGSRYVPGGKVENWSLLRKVLSRFANWYARILIGFTVSDLTAGFVGFRADFLRKIDFSAIKSQGYAYLIESKYLALAQNPKMLELPITFTERINGRSKLGSGIIWEGIRYPLKVHGRRIRKGELTLVGAWAVFLTSFLVYCLTLPRSVYLGDSPEFIAAVKTLGIAHPSGYPGYIILAKLFSLLPFGNLEFRIGLFSALAASVSLVLVYFLICKIIGSGKDQIPVQFVAASAALILGFSDIFWSQAIMAKMYTLFFLILMAIFWLAIKYAETGKFKYLLVGLFFFGFGVSVHLMIILFIPPLIFAFLLRLANIPGFSVFKHRFGFTSALAGVAAFFLGLSIFVYLPIRYQSNPGYDFARIFHTINSPDSLAGTFKYVFRSDYNDLAEGFNLKNKLLFFSAFEKNIFQQFGWLLILAFGGFLYLSVKGRKYLVAILGILLMNSLGIILLRSSGWSFENEFYYSFYYLPAYGMIAILIGVGLYALILLFEKRFARNLILAFCLLSLLVPAGVLSKNWQQNNQSRFTFLSEYLESMLKGLPPDAVLLVSMEGVSQDSIMFGLHFQQIVKNIRPDADVLTIYDIHPEVPFNYIYAVYQLSDIKHSRYQLVNYVLKNSSLKNRPIFTTFLTDDLPEKGEQWDSVSNGLVYKLLTGQDKKNADYVQNYIRLDYRKDEQVLASNLFGRDLLAQYFYSQAALYAKLADLRKTQESFIQAIKFDDQTMGIDATSFIKYRSKYFTKQ